MFYRGFLWPVTFECIAAFLLDRDKSPNLKRSIGQSRTYQISYRIYSFEPTQSSQLIFYWITSVFKSLIQVSSDLSTIAAPPSYILNISQVLYAKFLLEYTSNVHIPVPSQIYLASIIDDPRSLYKLYNIYYLIYDELWVQ